MPGVMEEMERLDKEKALEAIEKKNKIVIEENSSDDDEEDVPVKITKKEASPVKAAPAKPTGSVEQ